MTSEPAASSEPASSAPTDQPVDAVDPTDLLRVEQPAKPGAKRLGGPAQGDIIIRAESLVRSFGKGSARHQAVASVSFEVRQGEVVLLFGPSGSGKSTLLALVGGLDRQYQGKLELFGRDVARLSDAELSQLRGERIGFVFQAFHLLEHLSVLDNVAAPALFGGPSLDEAAARALAALDRVGLRDRASARPSELSGGQRQRVAIARALLRQPALLLCDEPTGNLDRKTGESIVDLFQDLHAELNTSLVIVTHEHRLDRIANRTLHLEDGKLIHAQDTQPTTLEVSAARYATHASEVAE